MLSPYLSRFFDKPAPEAYARGLAFIMGRLLGKPPLVRAVAGWALEYLPAPEPTAAPCGMPPRWLNCWTA